mmetsp:Transcript_54507/g.151964  ORF Transcript_54507/g.151964 Transcript_54507/m.151964 type:complete len:273 (-) Transcript_54507:258-1076(-)
MATTVAQGTPSPASAAMAAAAISPALGTASATCSPASAPPASRATTLAAQNQKTSPVPDTASSVVSASLPALCANHTVQPPLKARRLQRRQKKLVRRARRRRPVLRISSVRRDDMASTSTYPVESATDLASRQASPSSSLPPKPCGRRTVRAAESTGMRMERRASTARKSATRRRPNSSAYMQENMADDMLKPLSKRPSTRPARWRPKLCELARSGAANAAKLPCPMSQNAKISAPGTRLCPAATLHNVNHPTPRRAAASSAAGRSQARLPQ